MTKDVGRYVTHVHIGARFTGSGSQKCFTIFVVRVSKQPAGPTCCGAVGLSSWHVA